MKKVLKKALSVMLVAVIMLTAAPLSGFVGLELPDWLDFSIMSKAATSGTCGENLTWNFDESTGTLTISGTGAMYFYYGSRPWENYVNEIINVVIDDGVKTIEGYSFYGCTKLTSIIMPDSVIALGRDVFNGCTSLTSITIPKNVIEIGESIFVECAKLESIAVDSDNQYYSNDEYGVLFNKDKSTLVSYPIGNTRTSYTIPESVTTIGEYAFSTCDALTSVTIGNNTTTIGDGAFFWCANLLDVTMGNSVTTIGVGAFSWCHSLVNIAIPNSVTIIGTEAFQECINLTSVTIGDSVTIIGDLAFQECINLTSVTFGDSVTTIGVNAFRECSSLTSVIIPDSVISINDMAFAECYSLTSITIPKSVITIGGDVFGWCFELTNITVDEDNQYYSSDEYGVLFNKDKTVLVSYPIGNTRTSYTIPESVTTIGGFAFSTCFYLTDVTIPESVTTIGESAFYNCSSISSITIPDSVITIGEYAFAFCEKLTSIKLSNKLTTIEKFVLYGCSSLPNVTIPESVATISEYAFNDCDSLSSITIPESVTIIEYGALGDCNSLTSIVVDSNNPKYSNDEYGVLFNKDKTVLVSYPIGNTRTNYTIPDKVQEVESGAFIYCKNLTNITIPNSVTLIDYNAFFDCSNITDVHYLGTEKQWNEITIEESNEPILNATIHFNGDEEHVHSYESIITAPTCTEQGYTTYTCQCGESYISDYIEPSHISKTITLPASCTVAGMEYSVCELCGETLGENKLLPAQGHTVGEWEVAYEATSEVEGKEVQKCIVCGEIINERVIPKLEKDVVVDADTGVSMEYNKQDYDGEVEIVVEESFDGTAFDVIDTSLNASQKFIYDITMMVDGVVTQPNGTVTVKVPLPSGYDPNRSFVYHIDTETGKAEKMPTRYEDGYLVFETTHFSYYAIVEEYIFTIQTPSTTTIRHKDGIKLHTNVEGNIPDGCYVEWTADNDKFKTEEIEGGNGLQIISDKNGYTVFTATLYNEDGEILATHTIEMRSKAGFFDKIGSFFRSLFGSTKIYEY